MCGCTMCGCVCGCVEKCIVRQMETFCLCQLYVSQNNHRLICFHALIYLCVSMYVYVSMCVCVCMCVCVMLGR